MSWAELDGGRFRRNLRTIRETLPDGVRICAVLKANAYGHGLRETGTFLAENRLADMTAVANLAEAAVLEQILVRTGSDMSILLLGYADTEEAEAFIREGEIHPDRILFSACSLDHFRQLDQLGIRLGVRLRVHLRLDEWDSGVGISYSAYRNNEALFYEAEGVEVCGLFSHMYTSYEKNQERTERELKTFDALVRGIPEDYRKRLTVHVLSSPLVFRFPGYAFDMVRVGTALYGLPCRDHGLVQPVMRVCGRIYAIREVGPEVPLSYENSDAETGVRRIAQVMLGFGDCPCLLTRTTIMADVRGKQYPLADEACMDHLCLDITGAEDICVGDVAVLMGPEGITPYNIISRSGIRYVHSDWMTITTERLEKVMKDE